MIGLRGRLFQQTFSAGESGISIDRRDEMCDVGLGGVRWGGGIGVRGGGGGAC